MNKLTLKSCIALAEELYVPIIGDVSFRDKKCRQEDPELAIMFQKLRVKYPQYDCLMFHPVNEWKPDGKTSYSHYQKMLNKGMKPRICDFVCLPIALGAPVFLCEMKRKDISLSLKTRDNKQHFIEQITLLASQKEHGAVVSLALGGDNGIQAFDEYVRKYGTTTKSPSATA